MPFGFFGDEWGSKYAMDNLLCCFKFERTQTHLDHTKCAEYFVDLAVNCNWMWSEGPFLSYFCIEESDNC